MDDVPGISKIFGDRCRSHASASYTGVASSAAAAATSAADCNGVNPPNGKNGVNAIPCLRVNMWVLEPAPDFGDTGGCLCRVGNMIGNRTQLNRLGKYHPNDHPDPIGKTPAVSWLWN